MIDDRVEDGMDEAAAVAALGSPEEAARQILLDTPLSQLVKARVKPERKPRVLDIVLLVLGSPIWLPLLLVAACLLLLLYLLLWLMVLIVYTIELSLGATALGGVFSCFTALLAGNPSRALFLLGVGVAAAGFAVLGWFACVVVTRWMVAFSKQLLGWIKTRIAGKGGKS